MDIAELGEHKEAAEGNIEINDKSTLSSSIPKAQQGAEGDASATEKAELPEHGGRERRVALIKVTPKKQTEAETHEESKHSSTADNPSVTIVLPENAAAPLVSARTIPPPDENDLIEVPKIGTTYFNSEYNNLRNYRTAEVHWNYYDALHRSKPTMAAKEAGTNSLEDENLDTYFKKTLSRSKFNSLDSFLAATTSTNPFAHHTPPFDELLPMQCDDRRWIDLVC